MGVTLDFYVCAKLVFFGVLNPFLAHICSKYIQMAQLFFTVPRICQHLSLTDELKPSLDNFDVRNIGAYVDLGNHRTFVHFLH